MFSFFGYSADRLKEYVPLVRKYIYDLPNLNINAVVYPDGTEFSDEEIFWALQEAMTTWTTIFRPVPWLFPVAFNELHMSFIKLAAAKLLKRKSIFYSRNTMSAGDMIDVNDLENKPSAYYSLSQALEHEALEEIDNWKRMLLGYNSGVADISGGYGSGGGFFGGV